MKTLLITFVCLFSVNVFPQNITNTLGTSGFFTIKDSSNTYLTLSQSNGEVNILRSLRLENTTSASLVVLLKGTDRFLHDFRTANTFLGINSGNFTMIGTSNTAVGNQTLYFNSAGNENTALGRVSLYTNTTGTQNTAVGLASLYSNTIGNYNTAVGYTSLNFNTDGDYNTALGMRSLYSNTTGEQNTALGYSCLNYNTTGGFNTAVGLGSLYSNTTGNGNTAVGLSSLNSNTLGIQNTALGGNSLLSNIDGNSNTAVGHSSLTSNISGTQNTALGYFSGFTISTGSNLTSLGNNAQPSSGTATNQITLGNFDVTSLRCNVQTITSLSDARDKKNIQDLSLGLDFIMKVKPRLFNWDKREWYENNISDGSKMKKEPTAGFIAQELGEIQSTENAEWLNLVLKDNPEKLEATFGNLLPVMVKAIQELKVESEKLKVENNKLNVQSEKLKDACLTARQENIELKNDDKDMKQRLLKLEQTQNKLVSELEKFKLNESKMTKVIKGDEK